MTTISIDITEDTLRKLVCEHLSAQLGDIQLAESDVTIQVKSKQNYKSEWETAAFRAHITKSTP